MADAATPSNWIFGGRDVYPEFNEATITDATGVPAEQFMVARNVYQFRRYRIEPTAHIGGSLPVSQLRESANAATLSAYQGAQEIDAGTIHTGETRKYVCVSDNYPEGTLGASWLERHQVWEMRGPWEAYTWPTA